MLKTITVLAIILALTAPTSAADTPVFTVGKLTPNLAPGAISNVYPGISSFTTPEGDRSPSQPADIHLAYDDTNLYIYVRCFGNDMRKLSAKPAPRDSKIYGDDCVEVFLDPRHDHKTYYHLIVNAAGAIYDEKDKPNDPKSWDGDWTAEVNQDDYYWGVFITLPFKSLGISAPRDGAIWGANFVRNDLKQMERISWAYVGSSYHSPDRFGELVFAGTSGTVAGLERPSITSPGKHTLTTHLVAGSKAFSGLMEITLDGKPVRKSEVSETPNVEQRGEYKVEIPSEGKHSLCTTITDKSTKRVMMRAPVLLDIPPHMARLQKYRKLVTALVSPTPAATREKSALLAALNGMAAFAKTAFGDNEKWAQLGSKLDAIEPKVNHVQYVCADKQAAGYVLGTETPLRKIMRDRFFEGTLGGPGKISVARGEYEACQVAAIAYGKALENVSVTVSALAGPGHAVIPSDCVTLNLVDYVKTRKPIYPVDYVGWWPDPLMDMKPFVVVQGGIQPVWITVHPSEKTPAGIYKGTVTFTPANAPASTIPIEVRVWDFTLPKESHIRTAFTFSDAELKNWYGKLTPEMLRDAYRFLFEHRISPMSLYTPTSVPKMEDVPFCVGQGTSFFNLTYMRKGFDRDKTLAQIKEYEAYLKPKGWWDLAYVYGYDEIKQPDYQDLIDGFGFIKKEFPDLRTMCTVVPNEKLDPYVDIWVPLTPRFNAADAEKYTKAGDQVWWYVCCGPTHPYANYFVDYPAIDPRILSWMNWKYHVPGMLYYTITNWHSNRLVENLPSSRIPHDDPAAIAAIKARKRWPEVPWNTWTYGQYNGDGHLVYPGPNGRLLSSIRMECIRDGFEDYEMFYMLDELVKKNPKADPTLIQKARKLLRVDDSVVKSLTEYTQDPSVMLKYRQEVGDTIEKLANIKQAVNSER